MQIAQNEKAEGEQQGLNIFLDSLKSPRTKEMYSLHRKLFLRFVGRKSINGNQNNTATGATQEIIQYLKKLKDDGLSYSYRNIALAAIKHDYVMSDDSNLVLNWERIAKFLGENERKYEIRGYTHDEIQRLIDVADIRYKAIILLLASTGMRRSALVRIELRDMEYLKEYNLYKIKIYKKSKFEQICFTTPEAAEAIKLYLKDRSGSKYFHNVDGTTITMTLSNLAAKVGIIEKGKHDFSNSKTKGTDYRNEVPAVHGLRKFCITQMARAKVDTEVAKLLTGHSIGVRGRYLNYTEDDLLQEYLKAVDLLTINETNRLKKKLAKTADVQTQLDSRDKEILDLKKQLTSYESQMSDFTERQNKMQSQIQSLVKILTPLPEGQTEEKIEYSYELDKEGRLSELKEKRLNNKGKGKIKSK